MEMYHVKLCTLVLDYSIVNLEVAKAISKVAKQTETIKIRIEMAGSRQAHSKDLFLNNAQVHTEI